MTDSSSSISSATATSDDYTYGMKVHARSTQIIEALTDETVIAQWWTAATGSARDGDNVELFIGAGAPFVSFTVDHTPGTGEVTWTVTDCAVMADWVGTKPSFSVEPTDTDDDDENFSIRFRHVGLRPALECFDQCRAGWNHFMPSLQQFLETGEGRPNQPRETSA